MPALKTKAPLRLAMWSGPRNISTAMMRSWGNRPDTVVVDEPFYAYYLKATKKKHPGADEIVRNGECNWQKIVSRLTGPVGNGKSVFFQKQMTHHLLPEIDREWLGAVTNCFLIRDPADVITSYIKKNDDPALEDLGFVQQLEIFDWVRQVGTPLRGVRGEGSASAPPVVIDAKDVLLNPERSLRLVCDAIGVPFDAAMLRWPAGLRDTDGIWAKHWYGEVAKSTGFAPYQPKSEPVPERLRKILDRCRECYDQLYVHRLH